jgi:hypothetical protein
MTRDSDVHPQGTGAPITPKRLSKKALAVIKSWSLGGYVMESQPGSPVPLFKMDHAVTDVRALLQHIAYLEAKR